MDRLSISGSENGNIKPRVLASKNPAVTALQDLLFYQLNGIAFFAKNCLDFKKSDKKVNNQISRLLYLSNKGINFELNTMISAVNEAYNLKNRVQNLYYLICKNNGEKPKKSPPSANLKPGETLSQMVSQANIINAQKNIKISNLNIFSLQEVIRLSLCSSANYIEHVKNIENVPKNMYILLYDILNFLGNNSSGAKECTNYLLKAGELHSQVLELVIGAYERAYGLIERKKVSSNHKKGNAILVVGEDFDFLKNLLDELQDKQINVYTYGALNYAHAFPEINKYRNLSGIFVGQYNDFAANIESFPGVVVITSGNLEELTDIYRGRIFATEDISMLGISKVDKNNLKTLINAAYDAPGFLQEQENQPIEIGFGAKELEENVKEIFLKLKNEEINRVIVFLGCNYVAYEKKYLKKLIKMLPKKTAFVSLDCLFLRLRDLPDEVPLMLNFGQYINLYNFVRLLFSISGKFRKDINEMPFAITIKLKGPNTIAALLMLLSLGIKNIKINSDLPNYLTDSILKNFEKEYGLSKVIDAKTDAENIIPKRA